MVKNKYIRVILILALTGSMLTCSYNEALAARSVSKIQKEQDSLQKEIDALDSELYEMVLAVEEVSTQIAETEQEIAYTQEEIDETRIALEEAKTACENQYESMKVRIQYMYEADDPGVMVLLFESGSISEFLNRFEYVNDVYNYDREKLEQYRAMKEEIEELSFALDEQMAELEEYEQNLRDQKAYLKTKEANLDALLEKKKSKMKDLDKELKEAKEIARREAERKAAEAAARRAKTSSSSSFNVNGDLNPSFSTGISGDSVVSYARQFVGNPYVWGGTSLTNGCDCSGFVQQVYKNFGINWSGRMTSASFRTVGKEVSYNHMQAGDIVCYVGHVGIYMGNGCIVEAQSTATGITCNRAANCKSIITIRRVL